MAEIKKICPMSIGGPNIHSRDCMGSKCAWWCSWANCCAMVAIPAELSDRLSELVNKQQ